MNACYYYAFDDSQPACAPNACSMASDEYPLIVNCAGNVVTSFAFTTDNTQGREDYYLIYMLDGSMEVTIGGVSHRAVSGNIIIFPPRCPYKYVYGGGEKLSYLWVHFTGSYTHRFLEKCLPGGFPRILDTDCGNNLTEGFRRIFGIFEAGSELRTQELGCALEQLILNAASAVGRYKNDRGLEKSLRYIHSFYNSDIRIEDLAKIENVSYSWYVKLFTLRMGISATAYIINLRMSAACDMLMNTDMSIKQIGISVGYDDAHFFSRSFKAHTGMSPREFRKSGMSSAKQKQHKG